MRKTKMENSKQLPTKFLSSVLKIDKNWNVEGGGFFFNISDLNFIHFREEQNNTYTVTIVVRNFAAGQLFNNNKNGALKFYKILMRWKIKYQEAMRKHHNDRHNEMGKLVKLQEKTLKCHE